MLEKEHRVSSSHVLPCTMSSVDSRGDAHPSRFVLCQDSEKLKGPQQILQWDSNCFPTSFPSVPQSRLDKHAIPFQNVHCHEKDTSVSARITAFFDAAVATRNFATVTCLDLDRSPSSSGGPRLIPRGQIWITAAAALFSSAELRTYVYIYNIYIYIYIYIYILYIHIYIYIYIYINTYI